LRPVTGDEGRSNAFPYIDGFVAGIAIGVFAGHSSNRDSYNRAHMPQPETRADLCGPAPTDLPTRSAIFEKGPEKETAGIWLSTIVGPDGATHDITVTKSLGLGLDEEAVKAVQKWKFTPSTLEGKPVAVKIQIQVDFNLY
jgi:TonB family protein